MDTNLIIYGFVGLLLGAIIGAVGATLQATRKSQAELQALRERLTTSETRLEQLPKIEKELADREAEFRMVEGNLKTLEKAKVEAETNLANLRVQSANALNAKDEQVTAQLQSERAAMREQIELLNKANEDRLTAMQSHVEEQKELLATAQLQLKDAFKTLSTEALDEAQKKLLEAAERSQKSSRSVADADFEERKKSIEQMVKPIAENLAKLDAKVQSSDEKLANQTGQLTQQLQSLFGVTTSLSNALKKPQTRGSWGETMLKTVLSNSGLQEGVNYTLQDSTDREDGKLRADAVVHLPNNRSIVIDSKTPFDPYQELTNAETEEQRAAAMNRFLASVRGHARQLSQKDYQRQYDGADFVVMFLPHEAMYLTAVEHDPALYQNAVSEKVFMANPMTLISLLRSVSYVLDQEKLNKSAHEISDVGKQMYAGIRSYAEHVTKVGSGLKTAVNAYNDSVGSLERNVLSRARKLETLGAKQGDPPKEILEIEPPVARFKSPELLSLPFDEGEA
jgi:DNA recombination protein RmuC